MPASSQLWKVLHDPRRLQALEAAAVLDTPPEEAFDRLARLASELLDTPVALVSLVDEDRQFFKSQVGLPEPLATERGTPLSHSFCQHVVASAAPLVVADARAHPLLHDNLAVRDMKVVAYLGVPLTTPGGQTLGSLCAIDAKPRAWSEREVRLLQHLAGTVMTEIEMRVLARRFQAQYVELRALELQRDELVHMLVHDLRNPLTSLLFGMEAIRETPNLTPAVQRWIDVAREGGESLLRMVSEILDVSKAEAGRLRLDRAEVDPRALLERAGRHVAPLAAQSRVSLEIEAAADLPPVSADGEKLRRVLVNLVSNAVQHTPQEGRVRLSARLGEEGKSIVFAVADTGCGVAGEALGHLFEKYGHETTHRAGKVSTGLGLPFCKMAVEAHGGRITVESELGAGTVFRFDIPLRPA